jgi:hypothetical protein
MLAELAAANAAFAIIKQTVTNSGDLFRAGKAITNFVDAEETLKSRGNKKKNSFWRKVGGNQGSDLEEFMALESINQQKKELEQAMIYCGRAGLYGDWVKFQKDARVRRQQEAKERKRKQQELTELILVTVLIILGGGIAAWLAWLWLTFSRG